MSLDLTGISASAYKDYMLQNTDGIAADELKDKLTRAASRAKNAEGEEIDSELMDACNQFEAYFLEQIFKEMQKSVDALKTEKEENKQLVDFFKERTVQDIALESTKVQGLGFAQMLYENMKVQTQGMREELMSGTDASDGESAPADENSGSVEEIEAASTV